MKSSIQVYCWDLGFLLIFLSLGEFSPIGDNNQILKRDKIAATAQGRGGAGYSLLLPGGFSGKGRNTSTLQTKIFIKVYTTMHGYLNQI